MELWVFIVLICLESWFLVGWKSLFHFLYSAFSFTFHLLLLFLTSQSTQAILAHEADPSYSFIACLLGFHISLACEVSSSLAITQELYLSHRSYYNRDRDLKAMGSPKKFILGINLTTNCGLDLRIIYYLPLAY